MPGRQIAGPTTCMITEVGSLPRTKRICNDSRPTAISFRIPRSLFQQWFSGTARSQSGLGTAAWRLVCALARSSLRRSRRAFNLPRVTVYADALDESDLLNAIYEVDFLGFSYGFRPRRGPHDALDALAVRIERKDLLTL